MINCTHQLCNCINKALAWLEATLIDIDYEDEEL